jgi:hypothetical protein
VKSIHLSPVSGKADLESSEDRSGLKAAIERDRRFFAPNSFHSEYTRKLMPGEFPPAEMPYGIPATSEVCGLGASDIPWIEGASDS